jgi:hypothetical protein
VRVGILGFLGSGKTTLLGALMLHLARGGGGAESPLAFHGLDGHRSMRDLSTFADAIEKGGWPPRTSTSGVAEYTIVLRERTTGRVLELKLPEMSGELVEEIWKTDRIPGEIAFIKDYTGLLLLIDAAAALPERLAAQYVHLLQALKRARGVPRRERSKVPVGLVFTKWDALPEEERELGAEELAAHTVPLLVDFVVSNFESHRSFGLSAVGGVDAAGRPLLREGKLCPFGLIEPFGWILAESAKATPPGVS